MKPLVLPEFRVTLHWYADGAWISIDNTTMLSPSQQWGDHGLLLIRSHKDVERYPLPSHFHMARPLVRPAYSDLRDSWSFAFQLVYSRRFFPSLFSLGTHILHVIRVRFVLLALSVVC